MSDIFSLGVVFYEMLTGELPLGRFPPPSRKVQVDVRLDEVVLKALEKEPGLRYQRASHLSRDVSQFGGPTTSAPGAFVQAGPRGVQIRLPGATPLPGGTVLAEAESRRSGTALAAMLCAILSLCGILPVVGAVLALVLGLLARRHIRESRGQLHGGGMALFGVVAGIGALVVQFMAVTAIVGGMAAAFGGSASAGSGPQALADSIGKSIMMAPTIVLGGGAVVLLVALLAVAVTRPAPAATRLSGLAVAALLLALAPFLLGAVLLVGGLVWVSGRNAPDKYPVRVQVGQASTRPHSGVSIDELRLRPEVAALIRSAEGCSFDSARRDILLPLARRTDLNAEEQKLLAETVMAEMNFDSGRIEVLKALIANSAFCPEGHAAVSALSAGFDFDSEREEILKLLAGRSFPVVTENPLPAEAPPAEVPVPNADD